MPTPAHRQSLIRELKEGIESIGRDFEPFASRLLDFLKRGKLIHRGLNIDGHPVGHTVDSSSLDGRFIVEYSSDAGYFTSRYKKIRKDVRHALHLHPQVEYLFLVSPQECGPKAHTYLTNYISKLKTRFGINLEYYDSRRQAEEIYEFLLLNDSAVETLGHYLPVLEKVRVEFAATNKVPQLNSGYVRRPALESTLIDSLQSNRIVTITGVSGIGKSELAVAVAQQIADIYDLCIWISASEISSIETLYAYQVDRHGVKLNIANLLRKRSCFVILDDLKGTFFSESLRGLCGDRSAILVTSKQANDTDFKIPFLTQEETLGILSEGISSPCPKRFLISF